MKSRLILHLLVPCPHDPNIWGWVRAKAAASKPIQASHVAGKGQGLEPSSMPPRCAGQDLDKVGSVLGTPNIGYTLTLNPVLL